MSRTYRNVETGKWFRNPRHLNEESQLRQILRDAVVEDYEVSGLNRARKRLVNLPDAWDDIHVAARTEIYVAE